MRSPPGAAGARERHCRTGNRPLGACTLRPTPRTATRAHPPPTSRAPREPAATPPHEYALMPRAQSRDVARAVRDGRGIAVALRHLDAHRSQPETVVVAQALARFLVDRCQTQHAGWRTVCRIIESSSASPPWERCARRAVTRLTVDLMDRPPGGRATRLGPARQLAARRQAEEIAIHVDSSAVLATLGLPPQVIRPDLWRSTLSGAVAARSRHQVAEHLHNALADPPSR